MPPTVPPGLGGVAMGVLHFVMAKKRARFEPMEEDRVLPSEGPGLSGKTSKKRAKGGKGRNKKGSKRD